MKNKTNNTNVLLIGCGPHAKRIYVPLLKKYKKRIDLKCVVDVGEKKKDVNGFLNSLKCDRYFIDTKQLTYNKLNSKVEKKLNKFVKDYKIKGVIIATEPLTHVMYSKWALKKNLSILLDKPVSTYKGISTKKELAKKILKDYDNLAKIYKPKTKISFSLMSQRRFHPAFEKIKKLIGDCYEKTNCPVTSIQSFHCDGQWRMPTEIVEQIYHPYCQGYGKCSHSGYHFFDIVPFLIDSSYSKKKKYDNLTAYSTAVRPLDFLQQVELKDYENLFGKKSFSNHNKYSEKDYKKIMGNFGEIDAFTNLEFKKGNNIITLASINLIHNGFAQRNWISAEGRDLYKGNGRVRQESHIIQQGPFQAVHYHSYQSKEVDPTKTNDNLYDVGGEYHSDIYIFKNSKVIGGETFEKISIKNLNKTIMEEKSRGHQEDARAKGFLEFVEFLEGKRKRKDMTSDFLTHRMGSLITSLIYQSYENSNAKMSIKIK